MIQTLDFRLQTSDFFKRKTNPCSFVQILLLHDMQGVGIHPLIGYLLRIRGQFLRGLMSEVYGLPSEWQYPSKY